MIRLAPAVIGLSALSAIWLPMQGQAASPIAAGTQIRVVIPDSNGSSVRHLRGSLLRLDGDTALVLIGGYTGVSRPESLKVALENGRRLELLQESHSYGRAGAALGALIGGVTGDIVGSNTPGCKGGLSCIGTLPPAFAGALLGSAGGALLGLVIGSSIRSETWVPVETSHVRVGLMPQGLGVRIALPR